LTIRNTGSCTGSSSREINLSDARFGEALALHRAGRLEAAVAVYEEILAAEPDHTNALNNLGTCLIDFGRAEAAIDILSRGVALAPADADLLNNLGNALQRAHRAEDAVTHFEAASANDPDNAVIRLNLAKTLLRLGDYGRGVEQLDRARTLDPQSAPIAFADLLALPVIYESETQIETARARFENKLSALEAGSWALSDPAAEVGLSNFYLPYQGVNDRDLQERLAALYLKACPNLQFTAPHCASKPNIDGRKIRIGFVSAHLGSHTIGKLFRGLIQGLDPNVFETTVFHLGPDRRDADADLRSLSESVDGFVPVPSGLRHAQTLIASHETDVLYYLDIGMEPTSYFLAFARLAPVQCASWGHPVTTGIPNVDYFLSWSLHEPGSAAEHYSETLKLFEGFCTSYASPVFEERPPERAALGVPAGGTLYVCPQSLFKFHPADDALWGEILRRDPTGQLIIPGGQQMGWGRLLKERFERTVPDVADRIDVLPRLSGGDFLKLLQTADVVLDTPRWSGGSTSFEAFAAGKPIVTLPGEFMRGLFTVGLYRQMGLEELVPDSQDAYVDLAVRLGTDQTERARCEALVQDRSTLLFNNSETVETHSEFFRETLNGLGHG